MKFISWNVNGLRACVNKGFMDSFYELEADFFCLQETKLQEGQIELDLPGYYQYWCYAQKKGYSGTAIFTKHKPLSVSYGLGVEALDTEGRLITLEYQEFYLVTCYTPNAQRGLARIDHRLEWEKALGEYLKQLDAKKPVVYCGDLNVAHQEIDLKNPASNRGNAGFSDQEREAFTRLLDSGFTDTFRHLYPEATGAYSWWSYMFNARQNNAGWRIDYFVVSDRLADSIADATIHPDILGSDHCPVGLDLNTTCNGSIWSPDTKAPQKATDADRETSGGVFALMLKGGTALMSVMLLLFIGMTLWQYWVSHNDTKSAGYGPLVAQVSYLENEIMLVEEEACFRSGGQVWKPVGSITDLAQYQRSPTFCAVVTFVDSVHFTVENLPQLQYTNNFEPVFGYRYFYQPYLTHQFFYGEDGRVAGFLLMGDVPEDITTTMIVQDVSRISRIELTITAEKDETNYKELSTGRLIVEVCSDPLLTQLRPFWYDSSGLHYPPGNYDLDYFVTNHTGAVELMSRVDALESMLVKLAEDGCHEAYLKPNIITLLGHEAFQEQMSQQQKETYQTMKLLYGYKSEDEFKIEIVPGPVIIDDNNIGYIYDTTTPQRG